MKQYNKVTIKSILKRLEEKVIAEDAKIGAGNGKKPSEETIGADLPDWTEDKPETEETFDKVSDKGSAEMQTSKFDKVNQTASVKKVSEPKFDKVAASTGGAKQKEPNKSLKAMKESTDRDLDTAIKLLKEALEPEQAVELDGAIKLYFEQSSKYERLQSKFNKDNAALLKSYSEAEIKVKDIMNAASITVRQVDDIIARFGKGTDGRKSVNRPEILRLLTEKLTPELKKICEDLTKANTTITAPTAPRLSITKVAPAVTEQINKLKESIEKVTGKKVVFMKEGALDSVISWLKNTFTGIFSKDVLAFRKSAKQLRDMIGA